MAAEHQIRIAREALGIRTVEDWTKIAPSEVVTIKGCGPQTLNHLRIYLAARGLTLRDDQTPAHWQQHLSATRIGATLGEEDTLAVEPYTILIDSQEKQPFRFEGHLGYGPNAKRRVIIPTQFRSLGTSHGDYTIDGCEFECHIERKSAADAIGTFLATPGGQRNSAWLATLAFLAEIPFGFVVIELPEYKLAANVQPHGKRSKAALAKTLLHQVDAWRMDFGVQFIFCDSRRCAEEKTLNILRRAWRLRTEEKQLQLSSAIDEIAGSF